ncbi:MAG: AmmeMemoRadiSam system protein B [Phycisphaerales bacterium]|nr:AmmeMemoRadiSam system protein B [Phycisphaerales bacterium]
MGGTTLDPSMSDLPEHLYRPHVRPFQPVGVEKDKQVGVGLRDPMNLTGRMMVVPPQALGLIQSLQGEHSLEQIAEAVKAPIDQLRQLVANLDESGMLWGPTFERLEREAMDKARAAGALPATGSKLAGETRDAAEARISALLADAEDAELGSGVLGIVAPHLDLDRGGANYAAAYKVVCGAGAPDRVVVLGTNHFGLGDGVVATRLGQDSPLGMVASDAALADTLERALGDRLFKDEADFLGEHSVQFHIPWIAHTLPGVPVFAALVPDPMRAMISDDGARASFQEFRVALRDAIKSMRGRTLVVASADLSHVGPAFGDPGPVGAQVRRQIEEIDRGLLAEFASGDMEAFIQAIRGGGNATRWCSVGNMAAALFATGGTPELIQYSQSPESLDPQGTALITSAAMAIMAD